MEVGRVVACALGVMLALSITGWKGDTTSSIFKFSPDLNPRGNDNLDGEAKASTPIVTKPCHDGNLALSNDIPYTIPVHAGWNLVSIYWNPYNTSLPGVLTDNINDGLGFVQWNRVMAFFAWDIANPWRQYYIGWDPSLNDLTFVNRTMGLWLNVTAVGDGNITQNDADYYYNNSTTINLYKGWNLVGFPSDSFVYTVSDFKADTGAAYVEGYSPTATYKTTVLLDPMCFIPSQAYWAYIPSATTWTVLY